MQLSTDHQASRIAEACGLLELANGLDHPPDDPCFQRTMTQSTLSAPLRITTLYVSTAALWILLSDRALLALGLSSEMLSGLHTAKGLLFILVTGGVLFVALRRSFGRLTQTLEALGDSQLRYRELVEATSDWVWEVDAGGRYTYVSPRCRDLLGYEPEELLGRTPFELMPPEEAVRIGILFAGLARDQSPIVRLENVNLHKDGHEVIMETNGQPILSAQGSLVGYRGIDRDITERKRIEAQLAESRKVLRTMIDVLPLWVSYFDTRKHYVIANRRYEQTFGHPLKVIEGAYFADVMPAQLIDAHGTMTDRCLSGEAFSFDEVTEVPSLGQVAVHGDYVPVRDENGQIIGGVVAVYDVTEQKAVEAALREAHDLLEARVQARTAELSVANRELESFTYSVSHDLRAPLRAVRGFSQALIEDYGNQLPEGARNYLAQIEAGSVRMGDLIDGLLTLSRSTRGDLSREPVDMTGLVRELLHTLAATDPGRTVDVEVEEGLETSADLRLLKTLWTNLLENAWKYTGRQKIARIHVYAVDREGEKVFCIADNGAGFDMEFAAKLFEPFQRLHRQDEFPGIGIGLATVQRIVHRHGGRIEAKGEPDKGATFFFTLAPRRGRL